MTPATAGKGSAWCVGPRWSKRRPCYEINSGTFRNPAIFRRVILEKIGHSLYRCALSIKVQIPMAARRRLDLQVRWFTKHQTTKSGDYMVWVCPLGRIDQANVEG